MSPQRLIARIAPTLQRPAVVRLVWIAAALVVLAFVLINAWVTEDAYITFRVADNAVHGYGLRWNVDERVQVYTHPLWLLLQIPFYALTREEFYTSIALSAALTLATWGVLAWPYRRVVPVILCVLLVPLISSHAFLEFSTSGLENPLAHLLALAFAAIFVGFRDDPPWGRLSLTAALLVMTRFDLVWIVLPAALYLLARHWRSLRWGPIAWGALPLVAWCVFSFLYYGSVMPNTKYAKLNTGVDTRDLAVQGLRYAGDLLRRDMPSALLIAAVLVGAFACLARRRRRRDDRALRLSAMGAGVWLYALYVVAVGGDFMTGRFFSVLVVLAVWWLAEAIVHELTHERRRLAYAVVPVAMIVALLIQASPRVRYFGAAPGDDLAVITAAGYVVDEREFYKATNTLARNWTGPAALRSHDWIRDGQRLRAENREQVIIRGNAGMSVFHAGPKLRVIDPHALTDPLLARLPLSDRKVWRIGHFYRPLPEGFRRARATGDVSEMDPSLGRYYRALRTIVSDPVFSPARLQTLVRFAFGDYDRYLDRYVKGSMRRTVFPLSRLDNVRDSDLDRWPPWDQFADPSVFIVADGPTYTLTAPAVIHPRAVDVEMYGDCPFELRFYRGDQALGEVVARPRPREAKDASLPPMRRVKLPLPEAVTDSGFDRVTVRKQGRCTFEILPAMLQHLVFL